MQMNSHVSQAISRAQTSFENGKLAAYAPLLASGSNAVAATCAAAWGPAMRR